MGGDHAVVIDQTVCGRQRLGLHGTPVDGGKHRLFMGHRDRQASDAQGPHRVDRCRPVTVGDRERERPRVDTERVERSVVQGR